MVGQLRKDFEGASRIALPTEHEGVSSAALEATAPGSLARAGRQGNLTQRRIGAATAAAQRSADRSPNGDRATVNAARP